MALFPTMPSRTPLTSDLCRISFETTLRATGVRANASGSCPAPSGVVSKAVFGTERLRLEQAIAAFGVRSCQDLTGFAGTLAGRARWGHSAARDLVKPFDGC